MLTFNVITIRFDLLIHNKYFEKKETFKCLIYIIKILRCIFCDLCVVLKELLKNQIYKIFKYFLKKTIEINL